MSATLPIHSATADAIAQAGRLLAEGRLVAFPTETVYGLGGRADRDASVAAIYAAKGRPSFNPLIVHVPDLEAAREVVRPDNRARILADIFWPGPLTLVLPRREGSELSLLATAGLDTVAVRSPAHAVAQALLKAAGVPVAAPSANRSGKVSPTTAAHVAEGLGAEVAMVLDGGPCLVGVESTVLDLSGPQAAILRPGSVTREEIESIIGPVLTAEDSAAPKSPGMLASHYAPGLPVRLEAAQAGPGEALLGFGPAPGAILNLSPSGDLTEAAANLFAMLRALDRPDFSGIAVMPIPERGLGIAINDRLRRAAAPRTMP